MTGQTENELTDGLHSNVRKTKRQGHSSSKRPYLLRHIRLTPSCVRCHPRLLSLPKVSLTMLCSCKVKLDVNNNNGWTVCSWCLILCVLHRSNCNSHGTHCSARLFLQSTHWPSQLHPSFEQGQKLDCMMLIQREQKIEESEDGQCLKDAGLSLGHPDMSNARRRPTTRSSSARMLCLHASVV